MSLHLVASDTSRVFAVDRGAFRAHVHLVDCALDVDPSATTLAAHMPTERVLDALTEWVRLCAVAPGTDAQSEDIPLHYLEFFRTHARNDFAWFDQQFVPECSRLLVGSLVDVYVTLVSQFVHATSLDAFNDMDTAGAYTRALGAFIRKVV
jgi:hypothetical protein